MSQPGFNGTKRIVDIAADSSLTALLLTGPARFVEVVESTLTSTGSANTPQGFQYQLPNDTTTPGFTTWFPVLPPTAAEAGAIPNKLELGDRAAFSTSFGNMLGNGPSVIVGIGVTPATTVANLRSATGTPTSVIVTEWF